jgi:hypothetical protein
LGADSRAATLVRGCVGALLLWLPRGSGRAGALLFDAVSGTDAASNENGMAASGALTSAAVPEDGMALALPDKTSCTALRRSARLAVGGTEATAAWGTRPARGFAAAVFR